MLKIAGMYHDSGGTCWEYKCGDCDHLCPMPESKKPRFFCDKYPGEMIVWNPEYVACRFLRINGTDILQEPSMQEASHPVSCPAMQHQKPVGKKAAERKETASTAKTEAAGVKTKTGETNAAKTTGRTTAVKDAQTTQKVRKAHDASSKTTRQKSRSMPKNTGKVQTAPQKAKTDGKAAPGGSKEQKAKGTTTAKPAKKSATSKTDARKPTKPQTKTQAKTETKGKAPARTRRTIKSDADSGQMYLFDIPVLSEKTVS